MSPDESLPPRVSATARSRLGTRLGWPSLCPVCDRWSAGAALCAACRRDFVADEPRCPACALRRSAHPPTCGGAAQARPYDTCRAVVDYLFPWDALVRRFKGGGDLSLAEPLADLLAEVVHCAAPARGTVVVPIPAAASRLAGRGYHPAWELARRVARRLALEAEPLALMRRIDRAQTGARSADRFANMRAAFGAGPGLRARVGGRPVLLIDDVMTTGATLQAAARLLRDAGASRVDAAVLARTPAPSSPTAPSAMGP